jgi:hypothetical protein
MQKPANKITENISQDGHKNYIWKTGRSAEFYQYNFLSEY